MPQDSPYGDLFDLPTGTGDINWENPSSQEMATIQQNPQLQMEYIQSLMNKGEYFDADYTAPSGLSGESTSGEALTQYFERGGTMEDFMSINFESQVGDADYEAYITFVKDLITGVEGAPGGAHGTVDWGEDYYSLHEEWEPIKNYFADVQAGMGKLQGGDFGISSLERELGLAERGVTGPGGLTQQKGSMADILQQKIGTRRQSYVPQEKTSRYGQVTGTGGGVDPTAGYLSGVGSDVSAYGAGITGIDKSIQDILTGTEAGSIHDIYGQYGEGVKKSLFGPGGGLWWEG